MKFIRDIISEKRGTPTVSLPVPPLVPGGNPSGPAAPAAAGIDASPHAPALSGALVETLDVAEIAADFVVNLFPESGDDSVETADGLGADAGAADALAADAWAPDAPGTDAAPLAAKIDQEFRTIRASASSASVADQIAPKDAADPETSLGKVTSKSPFDGIRAPETLPLEPLLPDTLRKVTSIRPTSVLPPHAQDARLRAALAAEDLADGATPAAPMPTEAEDPDPHRSLNEMPYVSVQQAAPSSVFEVPPPAAGRGASRSGRVKTRLLGFDPESLGLGSPFEKAESQANDPFPVGWLVVVAGPGRGASFALHDGVSRVGRGEDQTVCLNFGDNSISRENHVSIAYDSEQSAFYIGQSGRSNIVRLNNKPLLSTEQIRSGDQVRVGETTLRLSALCGSDFSWTATP